MARTKRPMVEDTPTVNSISNYKRIMYIKTNIQERKIEDVIKIAKKEHVYRNNMKAFIDLIEKLKSDELFTSKHSVYLGKLPMAGFIDMIIDSTISPSETIKNSTTLDLIIKSYKKNLKYFQFGDLVLTFTEEDIAKLLVAPLQGDLIKTSGHLKKEDKNDEEFKAFIERHFKDEATINKKNVEREIFATIKEDSAEACFDTVKLLLLYLAATFFVSSPNYILPWTLIPYCVCEQKLTRISWPKTIRHHLFNQVNKYYETPRKISACVTLFLWWICEKTHVLATSKDEYKELYPLAGKWDIKMLKPSMLLDIKYNTDIQGKEIKLLKQAVEKDEEYEVFYKKREQKFKDLITKLKQENRHLQEENTMLKKRIQELTAYTSSESADNSSKSADTSSESADTASESAEDEQLQLKEHDEMNIDQDSEENESVEEEGEKKKDDQVDKTDDKNDKVDNDKGDDEDKGDDKIDNMEIDIEKKNGDNDEVVEDNSRGAEKDDVDKVNEQGDNENNNAGKSIGQKEQEKEENDVEKVDEAPKVNKDKKEEHEKEQKEKEKVPEHQSLLKEKEFAKEDRRWIHYDSKKPRREGDHQRTARKMRNYINALVKKIEKKNYKNPKQIEFSDCPQQGHTVDCAIFVMNIMKQRSENKEIDKNDEIYTAEAADLQRAVLAYEILNCKPYSWTVQENLTQDYLLSTSNLND